MVDVQVDVVDGDGAAGEDLRQSDQVEPVPDPVGAEGAVGAAPSVFVSATPSAIRSYALRKSFHRLIWYALFVK